jgi:ABC-2 type transport system ATP-binding protein
MLRARNLTRLHGKRMVLEALDLELHPGTILGLLGPNGAGKSTTLQLLSGNLAPSSGSVEIHGVDLGRHPVAAKRHLGYLPEVPPLYSELTSHEYLLLVARLHRIPRSGQADAIKEALGRCGLTEVATRVIGNLSKGYRQRLGIAQAIVHAPAVIILDEPTGGLDPLHLRDIQALIAELGKTHAVLLSTHSLAEAETLCDQVLILDQGREVYRGNAETFGKGAGQGGLEEVFVRLVRGELPQ